MRPKFSSAEPLRRAVVVGQVEVGDAQVERAADDRALPVDRAIVAEVVPQPERDGGSFRPLRPQRR